MNNSFLYNTNYVYDTFNRTNNNNMNDTNHTNDDSIFILFNAVCMIILVMYTFSLTIK